jgi:transposase
LATLCEPGVKKSEAEIVKALTGNYRPEHVFALKQALALNEFYTEQVRECDVEIERQFSNLKPAVPPDDLPPLDRSDKRNSRSKNAPSYDGRSLLYQLTGVDLVAISGLNALTVQTMISEIGTDLSRFPTEEHFCSWLGLAPHNDISGGKVLRSRTLKTHNHAGQAFRMAAQAVSRRPRSALGAFSRRIKSKLGPRQAIAATAHKIARTFYHMLKHRTPFHDLGGDDYERRACEREVANLRKRATKLGMALVPTPGLQTVTPVS